jgi:hypothetical protein
MTLTDKLVNQSTTNGDYGKGYLHFHPDVYIEQLDEATFMINNQIELTFQSDKQNPLIIKLNHYSYAQGYNKLLDATVISYSVLEQTIIQIHEAH